jgi:hypothetical protein
MRQSIALIYECFLLILRLPPVPSACVHSV